MQLAAPTPTNTTGTAAWNSLRLGEISMDVQRTIRGVTTTKSGTQELFVAKSVSALGTTDLDDAVRAARVLSEDVTAPIAILQAQDGQLFSSTVMTRANAMNPPFLQMRGYGGAMLPHAFDYGLQPEFNAGYHDYSVDVTRDAGAAGAALRAIVTDLSVTKV